MRMTCFVRVFAVGLAGLAFCACQGKTASAPPSSTALPAAPTTARVAARPGTCAVPKAPLNLPAKYETPRVSAPGFPNVNIPFEQMTARARSSGKPAILYFCADWCGYCKKMNRETLADASVRRRIGEFPATMYDSDTTVGRAVANRFGIDSYPTMVLVEGSGRQVDQIIGARPPAEFLGQLARH